jgi:transcriptional regulator with XRE-family HTH domain
MMLDAASNIMESTSSSLHARIAHQVRSLRAARGLSLESMAARCDVSRSMLSLIERGESSPTAVVLEKIATGLDVPLATLFDTAPLGEPVARRATQEQWRDPGSGYVRRNVSPSGVGSQIQIVEVTFPAKARVSYETGPREPVMHQQVWVLAGQISVTVGDARHELRTGDCLALQLDRPTAFHNPTDDDARYAVVLVSDPAPRS